MDYPDSVGTRDVRVPPPLVFVYGRQEASICLLSTVPIQKRWTARFPGWGEMSDFRSSLSPFNVLGEKEVVFAIQKISDLTR